MDHSVARERAWRRSHSDPILSKGPDRTHSTLTLDSRVAERKRPFDGGVQISAGIPCCEHSFSPPFFVVAFVAQRTAALGQQVTSCSREQLPLWLCSSGAPTGQVSVLSSTARLRVLLSSRRMPSSVLRECTTRFSAKRRSARNTRRQRQIPSLTHQPGTQRQ